MMPYDKWDFICSYPFVRVASIVTSSSGEGGRGGVGWGGGRVYVPIYGLDRYVPPERVWVLRVSILQ